MSSHSNFIFTLFTNRAELAAAADTAGIDRIGVDLESIGKQARQGHLNTWISDHQEHDLPALRPAIRHSKLFARCNPVHPGLQDELDRLLAAGVEVIMLPYFQSAIEAERFIRLLDGRATPVLLLETAAAAADIHNICQLDGIDEIHIGLNDLHLSLGWPSHFHLLVSDLLQQLSDRILSAGLRLGIGGLGRAGDNNLPIPADLVCAQLPRLGATASLISRAFFRGNQTINLQTEIPKLRQQLGDFQQQPAATLQQYKAQLQTRLTG